MIGKIKHAFDTGAYKYACDVLEEKVKTGRYIKLAAQRFIDDLKRDDIYLDLTDSRRVINFAKLCRHYKGIKAGEPIELFSYQEFYFQQLFGWKVKETGLRRIKRTVELIARKQGKTTKMAVQAAYHSLADNEKGAQVWVGATKKDQARICLSDIDGIIKKSPALRNKFRVYTNSGIPTQIRVPDNNGFIGVIGRDSDREHGLHPSMSIIDEWHGHKDTSVRDILASAKGGRLQPVESIISTAGFNLEAPCYTSTRKVGIDILEGRKIDDQQLILLYELDDYDSWEDRNQWVLANPNLYYDSSYMEELESEFVRAKNEGGRTEVNFKTKHLNIWMNSPDGWLDHQLIRQNNNNGITDDELIGKDCFGGLDLSAGIDLNAFSLFFPEVRPGIHLLKLMFWIPQDKVTKQMDSVDYYKWAKEGWLRVFDGNVVEYDKISDDMIKEIKKYNVKSIGCDPKYLYTGVMSYFNEAGYTDLIMPVGQTYSNLAAPTEKMETWVTAKQMDFMNNPVLEWNFSNVVLSIGVVGHKMPAKNKSINKIDGVAASLNAVSEYFRFGAEPEPITPSIEIWN